MNEGPGFQIERVTESYNSAGGAQRDEPKMTVKRTGLVRGNTEAKEMVAEFIAEEGLNPVDFQLGFGGNLQAGVMALYAGKPGDKGLMKVTLYDHSISFHAGAVFRKFPKLRPSATVDCFIEKAKDADGVPCMLVHILAGSPTRAIKRKESGESKPA